MRHVAPVLAGVAALAVLSGCTQTTAGTAHTPAGGAGNLAAFLLPPDVVDSVVGSHGLAVVDTISEITDHSGSVSEPSCAGAVFTVDSTIFGDSGQTGVAGQVLAQPADGSRFRVEQIVVAVPSASKAEDTFNAAVQKLTSCIGTQVTVQRDGGSGDQKIEGIGITGMTMTQTVRSAGEPPRACQHALAAAGDHVIETSVCGPDPAGEAIMLANKIAETVA